MKLMLGYRYFIRVVFLAAFMLILSKPLMAYDTDAISKYNEGIDLSKSGNYQDAISAFKKAVTIDPTFTDAYFNLGSVYEYTGDYKDALITFEDLFAKNPDDADVAYKIASIYCKTGNYHEALKFIDLIPLDSDRYNDGQNLHKKIAQKIAAQNKLKAIKKPVSNSMIKVSLDNFQGPTGIAKDKAGNLYVASYVSNSIWQITPGGSRKVIAKGKPINGPIGLAVDSKYNIYVANYLSNEILKISPRGEIAILLRGIKKPYYLYLDSAGTLYISEQGTDTVIKVNII